MEEKKAATTIPQMRIDAELNARLEEIADSYHVSKSHFVRTVLRIAIHTGVYRDWMGNKDGMEAANHDRHYLSLVLWLHTHNYGPEKLAEVISVSQEAAEKIWARFFQMSMGKMSVRRVMYTRQRELEAAGAKVDD
jgi:predicted transcriptional regulator